MWRASCQACKHVLTPEDGEPLGVAEPLWKGDGLMRLTLPCPASLFQYLAVQLLGSARLLTHMVVAAEGHAAKASSYQADKHVQDLA